MKALKSILIIAGIWLLTIFVIETARGEEKKCCPPEDVVIVVQPYGLPVLIPKGAFDDKDNYVPLHKFQEEMEKQEKEQPKQEEELPPDTTKSSERT